MQRRTFLATFAASAASSLAVGSATAEPGKGHGKGKGHQKANGRGHAKGHDGGGQPLEVQLHVVEQATKRYRDVEQALKEGYQIVGPYVPAMGWHLIHPERVARAAEKGPKLVKPPMLTYNLDGELGSVEYAVPLAAETPDLFDDEGADLAVHESDAWHAHREAQHVFSDGDGEAGGQPATDALLDPANWVELSDHSPRFPDARPGLTAGDALEADWDGDGQTESRVVDAVTTHPSQNTLHAWVHHENPHGVFAGFNPAFDQYDPPGGGHDHEHGHGH